MVFALIGIGILAPFALAIAMILSMESQRENQMRQIRAIADDWQKYLDNFDTGSSNVRHGSSVSDIGTDDRRAYRRFDDVLASTK